MPGLLNTAPLASDQPSTLSQLGLDEEEVRFYQQATGIEDHNVLAEHISEAKRAVSEIVSTVHDEDLIRPVLRVARLQGYDKVLKIGRSRRNPFFLSVGSRIGVDIHRAIVDGYPADGIIAIESNEALMTIGGKLFKANPRVTYLSGDPLDPYFLEAVWPFYTQPYAPPPALSTLKSLNPLHGQVSVISACFVFDQLTALQQLQLARGLAGLLSPESGSMVIGVHRVTSEIGHGSTDSSAGASYDSTERWADLWDGQLFQKGTVKVETRLGVNQSPGARNPVDHCFMEWTVTRL